MFLLGQTFTFGPHGSDGVVLLGSHLDFQNCETLGLCEDDGAIDTLEIDVDSQHLCAGVGLAVIHVDDRFGLEGHEDDFVLLVAVSKEGEAHDVLRQTVTVDFPGVH